MIALVFPVRSEVPSEPAFIAHPGRTLSHMRGRSRLTPNRWL